jgi:hypothetical protein
VGIAYDLALTGPDYTLQSAGKIRRSIYFAGGDLGGTCYARRANIIPVSTFSMTMWLKIYASAAGWPIWLGEDPHTYFGFRQSRSDYDNRIFFEWAYTPYAGATYRSINVTDGSTADTWAHCVATYDGDAVRTYWNSVLQNTDSGETLNPTPATYMYLNRSSEGQGYMDDVRIYDHVLTQSEIDAIYCNGNGTETQDVYPFVPVPDYPLGEATAYDIITSQIAGKERRRAKHSTPRRTWSLRYKAIHDGHCVYLWDFFKRMRGNSKSFIFVHPETSTVYEARFADSKLRRREVGEDRFDVSIDLVEVLK